MIYKIGWVLQNSNWTQIKPNLLCLVLLVYSIRFLMTSQAIYSLTSWLHLVLSVTKVYCLTLSFSKQVTEVCRLSFAGIRNLRYIRHYLNLPTAISVANCLLSCRLDFCNSLYTSLHKTDMKRLQYVPNTLAHVVTRKSQQCHITPVLRLLQWLIIE
jgi:hypothetical protein